ncbi:MAG: rane-associated zinc metalloprotease [Gemmatimonadetes bacterium]|jgi:regulator of sigma E protease|nr:rane-associated zinc metalloprotease [Gemmatimonadota bacterium]
MLAILSPLIVFGLVIFIHELGHFIAAKLTGVYAPRFSVGFGPALLRKRHGETEYVLAALPLGGYVRMASRHDAETAFIEGGEETDGLKPGDAGYDPEAMMPFGPKPVPEHRWFESKSLAARLFIMIAGVTMNIILAFLVYTGLIAAHGKPVVATRVVGEVAAPLNTSSLVQLQRGDTISAVNGQPVATWNDIMERIDAAPPGTLTLRTQRGELGIPVGTGNDPKPADIMEAIDFFRPAVIGQVLPGGAALKGGVQVGDTVLRIGGVPIASWPDLVKIVSVSAGRDLAFEVSRQGRVVPLTLRPVAQTEKDPRTGTPRTVGKIGAAIADVSVREPVGVGEAITGGAQRTWQVAASIVDVVQGLLTARVSVRELGGPIAITRASVEAGQGGLTSILLLIAALSVNVAVLNLLPIPILDGGQILVNIVESLKGSPFSARSREYILRAGLLAILLIFAMSTFNDVVKLARDVGGRLFG